MAQGKGVVDPAAFIIGSAMRQALVHAMDARFLFGGGVTNNSVYSAHRLSFTIPCK